MVVQMDTNGINLLGQAAILGDSRPALRQKDTKHIYLPGLFPDGKYQRFDVNNHSPWPVYGAPVHSLGVGKYEHSVNVVPGVIGLGGFEAKRPK